MAEQVLTNFIRALRSADVRVSTSESIDAAKAVQHIGYADRTCLQDTLRCVLAKSPAEKDTHDRLFDLYFSRAETVAPPDETTDTVSPADNGEPDLLSLIETGDETAISVALERAANASNLADIRFSTQVAYYAQKMLQAMGVERLEAEMMQAFSERSDQGTARAEALIQARNEMGARARTHARQAFETFGAGATATFRDEFLADKSIAALDMHDLDRMRGLVQKIAKRLATKHSRRRSKKNRGQLDIRKTLRANAGFDGVPFELTWKQTKKDRPKIIAICDVSGSVARVVRFLLMLLYSLNDIVPDIHCYAFSGRLHDVGPILDAEDFGPAMDEIIQKVGMSSTDYGQSLSDLKAEHWRVIDRRATIIMLGDGRSNYGDPRIDIFREATARTKRTIWLNPEGKSLWGTGDSEMLRYQPYCDKLVHVTKIKDLERTIDDVLASYS